VTVGSKNTDQRSVQPKWPSGTYLEGPTYVKTWSGGDRTPADRAAGIWPEHAYSMTCDSILHGHYRIRQWTNGVATGDGYNSSDAVNLTNTLTRSWTQNDDLKLYAKIADEVQQHDWNAGIFVGELGKTVDSIASRARQLGRAILAVKRGNVSSAYDILKADAAGFVSKEKNGKKLPPSTAQAVKTSSTWYGAWLELRYAWRPLVKDIYDLSEAIRTRDVPKTWTIKKKVYIPYKFTTSAPFAIWYGEGRYAKRLKCIFEETPFTLASHLGLNNPESIVWELVPYSFVADWFIPIGTYLQTRNTLAKVKGTYVLTTYDWWKVRLDVLDKNPPKVPAFGIYQYYSDPVGKINHVSLTRTVGNENSLPVPLPVLRNPVGSSPVSRALDAITLVKQAVGADSTVRRFR